MVAYVRHQRVHTWENSHKCDICTKVLSSKSEVVKHRSTGCLHRLRWKSTDWYGFDWCRTDWCRLHWCRLIDADSIDAHALLMPGSIDAQEALLMPDSIDARLDWCPGSSFDAQQALLMSVSFDASHYWCRSKPQTRILLGSIAQLG
mgnify:CR=1 FL=1